MAILYQEDRESRLLDVPTQIFLGWYFFIVVLYTGLWNINIFNQLYFTDRWNWQLLPFMAKWVWK